LALLQDYYYYYAVDDARKVIHKVKNRKCGWSRVSEGKLGCKVQSLPVAWKLQDRRGRTLCLVVNCFRLLVWHVKMHGWRRLD